MKPLQLLLKIIAPFLLAGCSGYTKESPENFKPTPTAAAPVVTVEKPQSIIPLRVVFQDQQRWFKCHFFNSSVSFRVVKQTNTHTERYLVVCGLGAVFEKVCSSGSQLEISIPNGAYLPSCFWDGAVGACSFSNPKDRVRIADLNMSCRNPPLYHYD